MTINGELVPPGESRSAQVGILNVVFEFKDGPATGLPWAQQFADRRGIFNAAIDFLYELEDRLDAADRAT